MFLQYCAQFDNQPDYPPSTDDLNQTQLQSMIHRYYLIKFFLKLDWPSYYDLQNIILLNFYLQLVFSAYLSHKFFPFFCID